MGKSKFSLSLGSTTLIYVAPSRTTSQWLPVSQRIKSKVLTHPVVVPAPRPVSCCPSLELSSSAIPAWPFWLVAQPPECIPTKGLPNVAPSAPNSSREELLIICPKLGRQPTPGSDKSRKQSHYVTGGGYAHRLSLNKIIPLS